MDNTRDTQTAREACIPLLADISGPVYRILDFSGATLTFSDVVLGLPEDEWLADPNIHSMVVGSQEMVRFAAESVKQEQYGGSHVNVFPSLEDAIHAAQKELGG